MRLHVLSHLGEGLFLVRYNGYTIFEDRDKNCKDCDILTGDTRNCNDDIPYTLYCWSF